MNNNYTFICSECGYEEAPSHSLLQCSSCNSPLNIKYSAHSDSSVYIKHLINHKIPLPIDGDFELISLGEGNTPVISLSKLSVELGISISAKLEYLNPTGSFKDRGSAILISVLKQYGISAICEDSSGNAGSSIAAYAAHAGIKTHIFAPENAPKSKIEQIKVYGATTHLIPGNRQEATKYAQKFSLETNTTYASHNLSPYFLEGTKIFAYEVAEQFDFELPDHIIMPVGNGSLFIGAWQGFNELKSKNIIRKIPKMHCIQTESIQPIYSTYYGINNKKTDNNSTIAGGIAVASPPRINQIIQVLDISNGHCEVVSEKNILQWQLILGKAYGLYVEPTAAAAMAGLHKLTQNKIIGKNDSVLIPLTGFGLKDKSPI